MILIMVDDCLEEMQMVTEEVKVFPEIHTCRGFDDAAAALDYAGRHPIVIAVLGEHAGGMDGAELGTRLREIVPNIILAYVCGQPDYAGTAVAKAQADLIMLKTQFAGGGVNRLLKSALLLSYRHIPAVRVRTFGRFDVFAGGRTVLFHNKKSKELLALCVDHKGGRVQMEEAADKLWPGRPYDEKVKGLYRKAVANLHEILRQYEIPQIFVSEYGKCYICPDLIQCDYYDFLRNKTDGKAFFGQYMFEYDWAEETNAWLEKKTNK